MCAYAQFSAALTVRSVAKGARKAKGVIYTHPDFIILDGWVDVTLPRIFGEATSGGGWTVSVGQMGRAAGQRSAPMEHWAMSSEWSAIKQIIAARMGNPGASWARVPTSYPRYVVG